MNNSTQSWLVQLKRNSAAALWSAVKSAVGACLLLAAATCSRQRRRPPSSGARSMAPAIQTWARSTLDRPGARSRRRGSHLADGLPDRRPRDSVLRPGSSKPRQGHVRPRLRRRGHVLRGQGPYPPRVQAGPPVQQPPRRPPRHGCGRLRRAGPGDRPGDPSRGRTARRARSAATRRRGLPGGRLRDLQPARRRQRWWRAEARPQFPWYPQDR